MKNTGFPSTCTHQVVDLVVDAHSGVEHCWESIALISFFMTRTELLVLLITRGNSKNVSPQSHLVSLFLVFPFFFFFYLGRQNVHIMKLLRIKHPYFLFMNNVRH